MLHSNATVIAVVVSLTVVNDTDQRRKPIFNGTGLPVASTYTVASFLCLAILVTVFGNSVAITAFFTTHSLRKVTNYFIVNLCVSDLMVACISMPFWVSFILTGWPSNKDGALYIFWISLDIFCGVWSIMSLAMISVERYLCISFPLYHESLVTKRRAFFMVAFTLAYSTIVSMLGYTQMVTRNYIISISIFVVSYVVPVTIKIFTYSRIYKEARKHHSFLIQVQKDKERLAGQKHLLSATNEAGKSCDHKGENLDSVDSQDPLDVDQQPHEASSAKKLSFRQRMVNASLLCTDSTSGELEAEHVKKDQSPKERASCFGRKDSKYVSSARLEPSKDTEATLEYAESCIGAQVSAESYEKLRKDGIDDWNNYLDAFEAKDSQNESLCYRAAYDSSVQQAESTVSSPEDVALPMDSTFTSIESITTETLPEKNVLKTNVKASHKASNTLLDRILPKNKSKSAHSLDLPKSSVRFAKSECVIEIKHRSMCRFRRLQKELKAAKVIGRVIGAFLMLWTPFMIVVVLSNLKVSVSMQTVIATKCLHYGNSAINPLLYVIYNKTFRKAIFKLISKMFSC